MCLDKKFPLFSLRMITCFCVIPGVRVSRQEETFSISQNGFIELIDLGCHLDVLLMFLEFLIFHLFHLYLEISCPAVQHQHCLVDNETEATT